jgi:hypothetical protein
MPSGPTAKVRAERRRIHPSTRERAAIDPQRTRNICLACGDALPPALACSGSLRCHDCRDANAPLRHALVELPRNLAQRRRFRLRPAA